MSPKRQRYRGPTTSNPWSGNTVRRAREMWAARLPLPCALCPGVVRPDQRWVVEHVVPRSQGGSLTDPSNQWVSHRSCSDASGGALRTRYQRTEPAPHTVEPAPVPVLDDTNGGQVW